MADERDATICPLCGSPAWRRGSVDGSDTYAPRREAAVGQIEQGTHGDPDLASGETFEPRVAALEQAVRKLRSALIGVAERHEERDRLPCYCVGERGDGHQEWCLDARAALAVTVGARLGRLRRADELWAALGLPGPAGDGSSTTPPATAGPHPEEADRVLDRVEDRLPTGQSGASGDRVACERCGGAHALEAKNTLLWYQCEDGSFYLGGIDGRLLLPRAPDPESWH